MNRCSRPWKTDSCLLYFYVLYSHHTQTPPSAPGPVTPTLMTGPGRYNNNSTLPQHTTPYLYAENTAYTGGRRLYIEQAADMGLGRFFCLLKITRSGKRRALKQIQDRSTPLPTLLVLTGLHENDLARIQAIYLPRMFGLSSESDLVWLPTKPSGLLRRHADVYGKGHNAIPLSEVGELILFS